jgi:predicted metalloprotease
LLYPRTETGDYDVPAAFPRTLKAPRVSDAPPRIADDETLVRAVERVWRPLFKRAGHRYEPARVAHFGDDEPEPCAPMEDDLLGLYCGEDRTIFFVRDRPPGDALWLYVVAHEVGHHVQELRGTLRATGEELTGNTSFVKDLHLREELQADCYAGVWAHAVRARPPDPAYHDLPDEEPGNPVQRRRWLMRGLRTGRPGACDTFTARQP